MRAYIDQMHGGNQGLPLAGHSLFATTDLDEARENVARIFCPHRLDVIGGGRTNARHHHVRGGRLSFNYIQYGAKTLIAPGELESFYLLQIPLSGAASIRNGSDQYASAPNMAAVLNPHRPTTMIWEQGTRQFLVQIPRVALQEHLASVIGGRSKRNLTFDGPLDLSTGQGQTLRALVMHLVSQIDAGHSPFVDGALMGRQFENTIMSGLLEAAPNNFTDQLGRRESAALPGHISRAEAYIQGNLAQALTIQDIAAAANTTPRTLQAGFRKFRDTTPLAYLRDMRLTRAHQDLFAGGPNATVTNIATRWGFSHLGRFSQMYRQRFGETPQATLRAAGQTQWSD